MLANGVGKSRANRNGLARPIATWNLSFLSAGEPSLAQHMKNAGRKPTAGQELRMAEIDADAGAGMGILEELHGHETPLALIESLREATRKYHGAVGHEYLGLLVRDRASSTAIAESLTSELRKLLAEFASAGSGPQIEGVARRFALVALAGELASKYGLTGWQQGAATKAAAGCLISWMNAFGCSGHREEWQLIEQVRSFFEANGASRFQNINGDDNQRVIDRAGFLRVVETELTPGGEIPKKGGLREYLVLPQAFRNELCAGFDFKFAIKVLKECEWLVPGKDKTAQSVSLPGMGKTRVYVISAKLWEDEK